MTRRIRVAFRADASLDIGTGHVMRCLTLAQALQAHGAECLFLCREHAGHLLDVIRNRGFEARSLPLHDPAVSTSTEGEPSHAAWLGTDWRTDADDVIAALDGEVLDWLAVDHYALDRRWDSALRPFCKQLLAIDDLADRKHDCDVLLDQNLGRAVSDYSGLVPPHARVLAGPMHALLRQDFSVLRDASLARRHTSSTIRHVLISMGGVDQPNATARMLEALQHTDLHATCRVTVVLGPHAPWRADILARATGMKWPTEVLINVADMGSLMAASDLAIGAAGTTSWERCCLGLPALIVVLADNQKDAARALEREGAAVALKQFPDTAFDIELEAAVHELISAPEKLMAMSKAASAVTDGQGADRLALSMVT
ncbi:MAG: UDP-2,4-diacetamido-2,4,6-trideoxy-beta-L-altropyranose hydrolase [Shinella sp.]|uniref:UDP-2,4-diacetamido-2,4, 6-trideoxy-beta-L-altropyranose hydrolase n=1 Tax=Shinella sp. TaxID=1870904 RepID=UPI0040369ACA